MENNVESILDKLSEHVQSIASTKTVIGEEFTIGEFTCKPVMKVGMGFGTGTGTGENPKHKSKGSGTGTGAGAGIGMCPIGFLAAKDNEIMFVPSNDKKGLQAIFEKVPDLMEKMMEMKNKKEKEDSTPDKEKK